MTSDKYFNVFITETEELMVELNEAVIFLETSTDDMDTVNAIFRIIHTIKGNSGIFSLDSLKKVTTEIEDLLSEVRSNEMTVDESIMGLLWDGVNIINNNLEILKTSDVPNLLSQEEEGFVSRVKSKILKHKELTQKNLSDYRVTDKERYVFHNVDVTRLVFILRSYIEKCREKSISSVNTIKFIQVLKQFNQIFADKGSELQKQMCANMVSDFEILVDDSGVPDDFLVEILDEHFAGLLGFIKKIDLKEIKNNGCKKEQTNNVRKSSFRIEEHRVNEIIDSVEKLRESFIFFDQFKKKLRQGHLSEETIIEFEQEFNLINEFYMDVVVKLARVKVVTPKMLFGKIKKSIHSLAKACKKKVDIEFNGKDILVDKILMETLESVFIHLVRNCVDHGIELPEDRIELNKPEQGTIVIDMKQTKNNLVIKIMDDGKGIDFQHIRDVALKKGKISKAESANIKNEQLTEVLFMPGITTTKKSTEFSGLGVGLDAVVTKLKTIGGSVDVMSELGKGTAFTLNLPIAKI